MNEAQEETYKRMLGVEELPKCLVDAHNAASLYRSRVSDPPLDSGHMAILASMVSEKELKEVPKQQEINEDDYKAIQKESEVKVRLDNGVIKRGTFIRFKEQTGECLVRVTGETRAKAFAPINVKVIENG